MPTAFVCNCDVTARKLVEKLLARGWRVPEDISVMGFDNYPPTPAALPEISSFRMDYEAMLRSAVQLITALVKANKPLSKLAAVMQMMPQSQYAANVDDKKKYDFDKNPKIAARIAELEAKYKDKGRLVIRASGTEPRVRVMIEGPDQREMDRDVFALSKLIERELK